MTNWPGCFGFDGRALTHGGSAQRGHDNGRRECVGRLCLCADRDLGQRRRDGLVAALSGVLVAHRSLWCGVPEAGHQLGQRGTRGGCQHRAEVAQIVEAKVWPVCGVTRLVEVPVEGGWL